MAVIDNLLLKINDLPKKETLLIAVDGRGGSGKSTLAQHLLQKLPNSIIIHVDDIVYPMDKEHRQRLRDLVIIPLKNNKQGKYQIYDHKIQKFTDWREIQPGHIIIIDGVSTLHDDLYKYFDFKIWIECPAEIGLKRGTARELIKQGVDTSRQWIEKYLPEEEKYVKEQKPKEKADCIVDGTKNFK